MTFWELLKNLAKEYTIPLKELIDDFIKTSEHNPKNSILYYESMIEKLDKEIQKRLKLKKVFEEKLKEERYKQRAYEETFYQEQQYGNNRYSYQNNTQDPLLAQYYARLEVPYGSNLERVKKAYKTLLKKYHPDFYSHDAEKQKTATLITQKLSEAYQELEKWLKK